VLDDAEVEAMIEEELRHGGGEEEEEHPPDDDEDMFDDEDLAAVAAEAVGGGLEGAAGGLAQRMAEAARARGLGPGAASSAMQALLSKLAGRAGGPSLEDLLPGLGGPGGSTSGTSARLKGILAGLRSTDDVSAQMDALTQLCELISMSHEETLARCFSLDAFVPLLVGLLDAEHNPDAMLLAARALTHLADVFPPARPSIVRAGALPQLCSRLLNIQYIDLAEQSLQALSKLAHDHGPAVARAGGLAACLAYLDFFSIGLQRVAVATAAAMCRNLQANCHALALESAPQLTRLLASEDGKLVEHAATALSRCAASMSGEPLHQLCTPELLSQALTLLAPPQPGSGATSGQPAVSGSTVGALVVLLQAAVLGCPGASKQLLHTGGVGVLAAALRAGGGGVTAVGSPGPAGHGAAAGGGAVQAWADHVADVVGLVTALLPVVPAPGAAPPGPPGDEAEPAPGGRGASRGRRSSRHSDGGAAAAAGDGAGPSAPPAARESYADILARDCPELIDAMATELVPVLIPLASGGPTGTPRGAGTPLAAAVRLPGMGPGTSARHRALGATHRLVHFASPGGLGGILAAPQSTASFIACLLQSGDSSVLMPALQITDTLLSKAAAVMGRAMVKEGALHALGVIAATSAPTPPAGGPSPQVIAYAATLRQRHAAALGLSSDVQAGGAGDDLARLTGLCAALAAADEPAAATEAAEKRGEEALRELLDALGSADGGVSTFEFLESGVAHALLAYLTASRHPQPSRQAAGTGRLRALLRHGAAANVGARSLVRKLLDAVAATERLPATSLSDRAGAASDSGASIAAASLAALARPFKLCLKKDAADRGVRDYSTNVVLVEPLASLSAVEEFLLPRVHIRRTPGSGEEAPGQTAPGQSGAEPGSRATRAGGSPGASAPPVVPPAETAGSMPVAAGAAAVMPAAPTADAHQVDMDEAGDLVEEDSDDDDGDDDGDGDEGMMFGGDDDMVDEEEDGGDGAPDREMVHTVDVVNPSQTASEGGAAAAPPTQAGNSAAAAAGAAAAPSRAAAPSAPTSFAEAAARGASDGGAADAAASGNAHLVFSVGGIRCGLKTTVMQAVYAASVARAAGAAGPSTGGEAPRRASENGGMSLWDEVHTITYRLATPDDGDATEALPGSAPDAAVHAGDEDGVPLTHTAAAAAAHKDGDSAALDALWSRASRALPAAVTAALGSGPASDAVALLRLLHLCGLTQAEEFISPTLGAKLSRQLCDAVALSSGALPSWTTALPACASFLFSFDLRRQLFFATALGVPRALHRLQTSGLAPGGPNSPGNEAAAGGGGGGPSRVARLLRQKVRITRTRVLDSAAKVFALAGTAQSVLEVEFFGEEGTGTGPTLEFYTLVSREFTSKAVNLWRDVDEPITKHSGFQEAAGGEGDAAHMETATSSVTPGPPVDDDQLCTRHGLFPAPLAPDAPAAEVARVCDLFALLGRAAAKAIQDGRLLDVPLSGAFYKAMQGKVLTSDDVASFDPRLGATLSELAALARVADTTPGGNSAAALEGLQLRGVPIQDLCITFTVPGQPGYQLCPGGADLTVTGANLSAYVAALTDSLVGSGVARQMMAFRAGFAEVCAPSSLRLFSPSELEALLCGAGERWTPDLLAQCLRFDHGYTVSSPPVQALISVLCDLSTPQQQAFLRFVTGAPRLPPGGLAKLHPRLTIVCKHPSGGAAAAALGTSAGRARLAMGTAAADGDLPSAMTCANYLKLPPYSSRMALKERLLYAVYEGSGSFLLS
jgi:E3 ubiquitin-protein ligase TRIP12